MTALSGEDLKKTELYHANAERRRAQAAFADYGAYLDSLAMTATIRRFEPLYMQRIAQLTNKSNQFNLTTLRCSEDDIRAMADDENCLCLYGKLVDKFGDNGVVTVVSGEQEGQTLHLRLWLMSCRVLKRGMEDAMMDAVVADAAARGVKTIRGYYYPPPKTAWSKISMPRWALQTLRRTPRATRSGRWIRQATSRAARICASNGKAGKSFLPADAASTNFFCKTSCISSVGLL